MLAVYEMGRNAVGGARIVRERPEEAPGHQPEPRRGVLDTELLLSLQALRHAEARVHRVESRVLAWMRDHDAHLRLGFSSFGDLARMVQLAPRTAQERVLLHRLLHGRPRAEEAFRLGELSLHQVLALSPFLKEGDLERHGRVDWIESARGLTVSELRRRVRAALAARAENGENEGNGESEESGEDGGHGEEREGREGGEDGEDRADCRAPGSHRRGDEGKKDEDPRDQGHEEDPPVRAVSFTAPPSAALAWDGAMETARRVLGWEAPTYSCVEAILVEVSSHTATDLGEVRCTPGSPAHSAPAQSAPALDSAMEMRQTSAHRDLPPLPPPRLPSVESLRRARASLRQVRRQLRLLSRDEAIVEPSSPPQAAHLLRDGQRRSRSLRALLARLLRDLRDTGALSRLGFRGFDDLERMLGLSERAARELRRQADLFDDHPAIETAFSRGRIGSEQASLIARVATPGTVKGYIRRASSTTYRQFAREVRLRERICQFDPDLAGRCPGPLPHRRLEECLREELLSLGWRREKIEADLEAHRLGWTSEESEESGEFEKSEQSGESEESGESGRMSRTSEASGRVTLADPACNPIVMRRLERLLALLIESASDEACLRRIQSGERQTSARPHDSLTSQRAAFVGFRSALTRSRREHLPSRIFFRAPTEIADHGHRAIEAIRAQFVIEIPGPPVRQERLPTWAAALLLLQQALEVWTAQDPATVPTERRILERDEYRCGIPGCSRRRSLEVHHVQYRSRNGSDRMINKLTLSHTHHKMIHPGVIRLQGHAPHDLTAELGCEEGQEPLLVARGERLVWTVKPRRWPRAVFSRS